MNVDAAAQPREPRQLRQTVLLGKTSWLFASNVVSMVSGLVVTPYVISSVGNDSYGLWAVVGGFVGYLTLLDFGLAPTLTRHIAQYAAEGRRAEIRQAATAGVVFYLALAVVLAPVVALVVHPSIGLFKIPRSLRGVAVVLVWLSFLQLFLAYSLSSLRGVLLGLNRIRATAVADVVSQLVYVALVVVLLHLGAGIYSLVAAAYARLVIQATLAATFAFRDVGVLFTFRISRRVARELASFSGWMQLISMSSAVNVETDRIVIGAYVGVADVTAYEVANRAALLVRTIPFQLLSALLPAASRIHANEGAEGLDRDFVATSRTLASLTFAVTGMLASTAPYLLRVWLGGLHIHATTILLLLLAAYSMNNVTGVGTTFVRAMGIPRYETYYAVMGALLNIGFTIALAPAFGVVGIVTGTVIGTVLSSVWFLHVFLRLRSMSWWAAVGSWFVPILAAAALASVVTRLAAARVPTSWWMSRATGLPALAGFAGMYLTVFLGLLIATRVLPCPSAPVGSLWKLRRRAVSRSRSDTPPLDS